MSIRITTREIEWVCIALDLLMFVGEIPLVTLKGEMMSEGHNFDGSKRRSSGGGGSSNKGRPSSSGGLNLGSEYIDYDAINSLQAEIDEKYAEIERLKGNIKALSAEISQKYTVLNAMDYRNPGRKGLKQEIENLKSERSEEQKAIDDLRTAIKDLKSQKQQLS